MSVIQGTAHGTHTKAETQTDPWPTLTTPDVLRRFISVEVLSFLIVGGLGYLVDVGAFNVLWGRPPFDTWDPIVAKVVAVALAMVVTYVGNVLFTWRGATTSARQVLLFIVFNVVGLGFSVLTLWISHDLLGLTSRLDDNLSANVLGLAMGTVFRFWSYRHFVFDGSRTGPQRPIGDSGTITSTVSA
jgi:putative flippase GtrA